MYVLQSASGQPAALLDWNNNYGEDPNKGVVFHCSNLPKSFFGEHRMDYQEIIAGTVGKENTFGTIVGRVAPGPFTYCRVSTDDLTGCDPLYVGEGRVHRRHARDLRRLRRHRGAGVPEAAAHDLRSRASSITWPRRARQVGGAVHDAVTTYLGWDTYHHHA